ncbi:hypothetical protein [Pantoea wallisii]|nr:hypothetical protein [Pantoea wallisii]
MSEQTVIAPTNTEAEHDLSPLESFANETATTSAVATPATGAPAAALFKNRRIPLRRLIALAWRQS